MKSDTCGVLADWRLLSILSPLKLISSHGDMHLHVHYILVIF